MREPGGKDAASFDLKVAANTLMCVLKSPLYFYDFKWYMKLIEDQDVIRTDASADNKKSWAWIIRVLFFVKDPIP